MANSYKKDVAACTSELKKCDEELAAGKLTQADYDTFTSTLKWNIVALGMIQKAR